jgi:hypothetical protein
MDSNSIIERVKELVKKGNVSRILVRKGDKILVDVPVNVGLAAGVATLALSKVLLIAGVLATVGFGCTVEVIKDDGQIVDVLTEDSAQKAKDAAAGVVDEIKGTFGFGKKEDAAFEETVAADEPAEEPAEAAAEEPAEEPEYEEPVGE